MLVASLFEGIPTDVSAGIRRILVSVAIVLVYRAVVWATARHDHHHGGVRTPQAMASFIISAGLVGPILAGFASRSLVALLTGEPAGTELVRQALSFAGGDAVAIITLVPMLVRVREWRAIPTGADTIRVAVPTALASLVAAWAVVTLGSGDLVFLVGIPLTVVAVWGGAGWFGPVLGATTVTMTFAMAVAGPEATFSVATNNLMLWTVGAAGLIVAAATDQRDVVALEVVDARDRADRNFDRAATPSLELTVDGTVVRANRAFLDLVGRDVDQVVGRAIAEQVRVDDDLVLSARTVVSAVVLGADREPRRGLLMTTPAGPGPVSGDQVVAQFTDLTEELAAREALRRSNQALSEFAHRVTHDLRSPLTVIAGLSSLIERDALPEDQRLVNLVQNSVRHGGPELSHVRLTGSHVGGVLTLVLQDDGRGVQEEDVDRIFEPGVHLREVGSGGSGLVTCRQLIDGVGGSIAAEASGNGARFVIRVPVAPGASPAERALEEVDQIDGEVGPRPAVA